MTALPASPKLDMTAWDTAGFVRSTEWTLQSSPIDLSSGAIAFQVRRSLDDSQALVHAISGGEASGAVVNIILASGGKFEFGVVPGALAPGTYVYAVVYLKEGRVTPIVSGQLTIERGPYRGVGP